MIYEYEYSGVPVKTGDIICTTDGVPGSLFGALWSALGYLVPGDVDHCVVYLGPQGQCVESAARGVIVYDMPGPTWNAAPLAGRRLLNDRLYGVAYPLAGRGLSSEDENSIRATVAQYCLNRARPHKPYNPNFFDAQTDGAYYCSQLVYKAYLAQGIDLNTNHGVPRGPWLDPIVFPIEIWHACRERRRAPEVIHA